MKIKLKNSRLKLIVFDPLKKLSQVFYNIAKGRASLERMNKILNAENKIVDVTNANTIESFNSEIEFKNVCFGVRRKLSDKNNLVACS